MAKSLRKVGKKGSKGLSNVPEIQPKASQKGPQIRNQKRVDHGPKGK